MTEIDRTTCPHDDLHDDPDAKPWGVFVGAERDGDGQPTHLRVMPSNGAHVAESDAEWLRQVLREHDERRVEVRRRESALAACPGHMPVQHRDRKPPWCNACGKDESGHLIGRPRAETAP